MESMQLNPSSKDRDPSKCRNCGVEGHNMRTCKVRPRRQEVTAGVYIVGPVSEVGVATSVLNRPCQCNRYSIEEALKLKPFENKSTTPYEKPPEYLQIMARFDEMELQRCDNDMVSLSSESEFESPPVVSSESSNTSSDSSDSGDSSPDSSSNASSDSSSTSGCDKDDDNAARKVKKNIKKIRKRTKKEEQKALKRVHKALKRERKQEKKRVKKERKRLKKEKRKEKKQQLQLKRKRRQKKKKVPTEEELKSDKEIRRNDFLIADMIANPFRVTKTDILMSQNKDLVLHSSSEERDRFQVNCGLRMSQCQDLDLYVGNEERDYIRSDSETTSSEKEIEAISSPDEMTVEQRNEVLSTTSSVESTTAHKRRDLLSTEVLFAFPLPPEMLDVIKLNAQDLDRLRPFQYLNDNIVDFYLRWLSVVKYKRTFFELHKMMIMSSHFFVQLTNDRFRCPKEQYNQVARWTTKCPIFEHEFIFIPIVKDLHWSLVILCHPSALICAETECDEDEDVVCGQFDSKTVTKAKMNYKYNDSHDESRTVLESQSKNDEKVDNIHAAKVPSLILLDSLGNYHAKSFLIETLKNYLVQEWNAKGNGTTQEIDVEKLEMIIPHAPTQTNGFDCGLFMLQYTEHFIDQLTPGTENETKTHINDNREKNIIISRSSVDSKLGDVFQRTSFTRKYVANKRTTMKGLCMELIDEYEKKKKMKTKTKTKTKGKGKGKEKRDDHKDSAEEGRSDDEQKYQSIEDGEEDNRRPHRTSKPTKNLDGSTNQQYNRC